jgi:hypothetical protein
MNELIKQLAEKASKDNTDGYPVTLEYTNRFAQNLAELIVRECANMAQTFHNHQYDFTGDLELHEFMLKYFGVEE